MALRFGKLLARAKKMMPKKPDDSISHDILEGPRSDIRRNAGPPGKHALCTYYLQQIVLAWVFVSAVS
jgi:hypothetical protein